MMGVESNNNNITIRKAVSYGIEFLNKSNIENADFDSFALLSDLNGMDRTYFYVHGDEPVSDECFEKFKEHLQKRSEHIPLQHILGKSYFYGYEFKVNENVLVPRSDTEVLVEQVKKVSDDNSRILDVCTGSGCIILTLAAEKHLQTGIGVDISSGALEVATENRKNLQISNVDFMQSDLFTALSKAEDKYKKYFDVIVSNPPYIRTDVIPTLSPEVKDHDPMIALDGFEDGLHFYRMITEGASCYLKQNGWLCYEIGFDQAVDVTNIMSSFGYTDISTVKDLNGLDRVVMGRLK